jgi:AhpD family alkylhydroperoxidase
MQTRIPLVPTKFETAFRAMRALSTAVRESGLESSLIHLVRLRVSQINGCGYCIDMHSKDARAEGESEQRLYLLQAWREAPLYNDRERAALAWAEAVTTVSDQHVPDAIYDQARAVFSESELAALTLAVVEINGWNRFCIAFNAIPGSYRVGEHS